MLSIGASLAIPAFAAFSFASTASLVGGVEQPTTTEEEPAPENLVFVVNRPELAKSLPFKSRNLGAQREAYYVADRFARCAVRLNEKLAREVLDRALERASHIDTEQQYYHRLHNCSIKRARNDREFMRGSLATHIVLRNEAYAEVQAAKTQDEVEDFLTFVDLADRKFTKDLTSPQLGFQCRAAIVPSYAYSVLEKEMGSDEESAAMARLKEATPFCDVLFKDQWTSNWFARSYIASGLYYWTQFREQHPVRAGA